MTDSTGTLGDVTSFDCLPLLQGVSPRTVLGAAMLGFGAVAGGWLIAPSLFTKPQATLTVPHAKTAPPIDDRAAIEPKAIVAANPYGALTAVSHSSQSAPIFSDPAVASILPLDADSAQPPTLDTAGGNAVSQSSQSAPESSTSAPIPPSRPPLFRPRFERDSLRPANRHVTPQTPTVAAAPPVAAPDNRNFFEKLFNVPQQPQGQVLAYAQPEDGSIITAPTYNTSGTPQSYDRFTAIYDIAAHTVYLPSGEKLEAHSGLGNLLDDPRYVNAKDRGATPPHVYDLELRKQLFHGVQALRLDPVGAGNMYGRAGLLAHTFMLGPKGDSNGCVSFRDYSKFLRAYLNGEVRHLVVVAHMG